jgi:D-alanine-D-alanine ligase
MKILILGGGDSPEREVSLRSAKAVANAARQAGFDVMEVDPKEGLEILSNIPKDTIVFPILHGKNGEDGVIQKEIEKNSLAYLGTRSQASADCFDKWTTREILIAAGLPVARADLVDKESYERNPISKLPHVLKVVDGGSSIGTLMIHDTSVTHQSKIDEIFNLGSKTILEELIHGDEITVPILDKAALPVIEIIPPKDEEFDYENKYNGRTQEICPPKNVSDELQYQGQRLAEKVHDVMNAQHLSRVDIMIDKSGRLWVLEINTIPGLTDQSLYPKSALVAGLPMPELIRRFVDMVKRDYSN